MVCLYRLNGALVPWAWSNYFVGAAATDLTIGRFCTATIVSCVPYNLMLIVAGAGLRDMAFMEAEDFKPASLGTGFWVVASSGAAIGLIVNIVSIGQLF